MPVKYVFVTGGVVSGLGKGITAASLGRLLKARGYKVTMQKFDPYINIDPGTMNPIQHGEVFVTDDGAETDLDLGHYERFIDESLTKNSNVTTGKVYWSVLTEGASRRLRRRYRTGHPSHHKRDQEPLLPELSHPRRPHIAIIEVGGTVGDIESQPFLEAIRQFQHEVGHENAILMPCDTDSIYQGIRRAQDKADAGERQRSCRVWVSSRISSSAVPSIRSIRSLKDKIALFCNVPNSARTYRTLMWNISMRRRLPWRRRISPRLPAKRLHLDCPEPDLKGLGGRWSTHSVIRTRK